MPIKSYRDLTVWQDAIDIVAEIYKATEKFPRNEALPARFNELPFQSLRTLRKAMHEARMESSPIFFQLLSVRLPKWKPS